MLVTVAPQYAVQMSNKHLVPLLRNGMHQRKHKWKRIVVRVADLGSLASGKMCVCGLLRSALTELVGEEGEGR